MLSNGSIIYIFHLHISFIVLYSHAICSKFSNLFLPIYKFLKFISIVLSIFTRVSYVYFLAIYFTFNLLQSLNSKQI